MTSDLKPCIFCKRTPRIVDATQFLGCFRVIHDNGCRSLPHFTVEREKRDNAIAAWNEAMTIAPSPAVARLVEACRDLAGQAKCFDIDMCYFREIDDALAAVEKEIS